MPSCSWTGRFIHHLADLLLEDLEKEVVYSSRIRCIDIGTGANLIYPIIGSAAYKWTFKACDIHQKSLNNAIEICAQNPTLASRIHVVLQKEKQSFFKNIIGQDERFALSICNPPFHASAQEAEAGNYRKLRNLKALNKIKKPLNFGGQYNELICEGGELQFIHNMATESKHYQKQVMWFSSLVSKSAHLPQLQKHLEQLGVVEQRCVNMSQGNKNSRFLAWTFHHTTARQQFLKTV